MGHSLLSTVRLHLEIHILMSLHYATSYSMLIFLRGRLYSVLACTNPFICRLDVENELVIIKF